VATYLTGRPVLTRRALQHSLESEFDVVHFHNPSLLGGPAALALGRGIKLYTAHEMWLLCPTNVLFKYGRRICERPTCWRCSLTYKRPPQLWRSTTLVERSLAELDALITPSRTSERLHEQFRSIVPIARIPHFVPDSPSGDGAGADSRRAYFLYVGRLEPIKGVDTLVRAFARRGGTAELVIAGQGNAERTLRRSAAGDGRIRFIGWQSQEALDDLYRHARAVVVPTRGYETFGLVPVEGFARATPTIARELGALAELLEESGGGFGFRTDEELHEALDLLEHDDRARLELGDLGLRAQRSRWSAEAHLRAYFGLITALAGARGEKDVATLAEREAERSAPVVVP